MPPAFRQRELLMSYHCLFEPIEAKPNYFFSVQPAKTVGDRPQQGDRIGQPAKPILGVEVGCCPGSPKTRKLHFAQLFG